MRLSDLIWLFMRAWCVRGEMILTFVPAEVARAQYGANCDCYVSDDGYLIKLVTPTGT